MTHIRLICPAWCCGQHDTAAAREFEEDTGKRDHYVTVFEAEDVTGDRVGVEVCQAQDLTTGVYSPAEVSVSAGILSADDAHEYSAAVAEAAGRAAQYTAAVGLRHIA